MSGESRAAGSCGDQLFLYLPGLNRKLFQGPESTIPYDGTINILVNIYSEYMFV